QRPVRAKSGRCQGSKSVVPSAHETGESSKRRGSADTRGPSCFRFRLRVLPCAGTSHDGPSASDADAFLATVPRLEARPMSRPSRYTTELIGTFFLLLTIGCTVILG